MSGRLPTTLNDSGAAWLAEIDAAADQLTFHGIVDRVLGLFGVEVYRYHVVTDGLRNLAFLESLRLSTFPTEWMQHYASAGFFDFDPVIANAQSATRPFRWSVVEADPGLSLRQQGYFGAMKDFGFVDGWGVPVFGPAQLIGYFGVGSMTDRLDFTDTELLALHAVCERAHLKMFEFSISGLPLSPLSKRETEILEWMSVGKTNDVIGSILGISVHTVDTHVRRIFAKLGAVNRTEAVIAGFQRGALTLERYRAMKRQ
jgi:DNA-binding CsgD family transcriptional regulator